MVRMSTDWRAADGQPMGCAEKLKVLEQNLADFCAQAQDILEDAALMGCDIDQVRQVLHEALAAVEVRYSNK
jgi:uncharacterized protein (UPF0335 family)